MRVLEYRGLCEFREKSRISSIKALLREWRDQSDLKRRMRAAGLKLSDMSNKYLLQEIIRVWGAYVQRKKQARECEIKRASLVSNALLQGISCFRVCLNKY